jgi:hypothetical protein
MKNDKALSAWPLAILDADGRPRWHTAGTNPPLYARDERLEALWSAGQKKKSMTEQFTIQRANNEAVNEWLTAVHYLHRPIIKSKLLAHSVYRGSELVGALLWATPHFTKKRDLFGMPGTLDKWEVLMLARFYLVPNSGLKATDVMAESIGASGKNAKSRRKRGWRLQRDWVLENPPVDAARPYVPRMLISWSDHALETVENCPKCGQRHDGQHEGTIYAASGWELWDVSTSSGANTGRSNRETMPRVADGGEKRCWVLRLPENKRAEIYRAAQSSFLEAA